MSKEDTRTSRSLLTCTGQGGIEKVSRRIFIFLILWFAFEIIAYLLSWFMFGSLTFSWIVDPIWIIIWIVSVLGWLSGAIALYYILLYIFSCRVKEITK
jgi:hypothetical protein